MMKVKIDTRAENGETPLPSIVEENGKIVEVSYRISSQKELVKMSFNGTKMYVEINDDYIEEKQII